MIPSNIEGFDYFLSLQMFDKLFLKCRKEEKWKI